MKSIIKRLLLGQTSIRQYVAIGLPAPQEWVRIHLRGVGDPLDITTNSTVAALRPLTLAVGFPEGTDRERILRVHPMLTVSEHAPPHKVLGSIRLKAARTIAIPGMSLILFETVSHTNYCLPRFRMWMHYLAQWRESRKNRNPYNFQMVLSEQMSLGIFYICPRPVVLVSVVSGENSNLFPMDLIGSMAGPYFLMALRSTSPAVLLMRESGRVALSGMSLEYKQAIYDLGRHHKLDRIEWSSLPFPTDPSPCFSIPVPRCALNVAERRIIAAHSVGSHTLFVTSLAQETNYVAGDQMAHISGFYHAYRQRQLNKPCIT